MSISKRSAIVVGITGGIACGKSEAGRILSRMGFDLCDADEIAHELMTKGTTVYRNVVAHFGEDILTDAGEISRPALGKIVFNDAGQRDMLNRLVHPHVRETLEQWILRKRDEQQDAAVQIPLLFESGMDLLDWDAVFCISADEADVMQRLTDRGMSPAEAEQRICAQLPQREKELKSDFVVPNTGTLNELETALRRAVHETVSRKG